MERITPNRLDRGFFQYQGEFEAKALEVLRSGWYVLGKEVKAFEEEFAMYVGARHCVGLASGLDALWIAFRVLEIGVGDEVIVQGNTYIASVMGITINGATPVLWSRMNISTWMRPRLRKRSPREQRRSWWCIYMDRLPTWLPLWSFARNII